MSRLPPQNLEAEKAVLGGILLDPFAWDQVADLLKPADFYKVAHQKIFETINDLYQKTQPVDLITVSNQLTIRGDLEIVGGAAYLAEIISQTPSAANISAHGNIVREKALLRNLISVCGKVMEEAYAAQFEDFDNFIDRVESDIFQVSEQKVSGLVEAKDIVTGTLSKIEELSQTKVSVTGVPTGFSELDDLTSGFHPGELIIIAARPSMGKTALSLNIAQNMALRSKKKVAYFSVEMSKEPLMERIISSEARIDLKDLKIGRIPDSSWPALFDACARVTESKLFVDDTSGISPYEIKAKCRRHKAQHGLDIIMIDYLQMMDLKQRVESRERAVSEMSRSLKAIAKELQVPVVALSQLNRAVEGRSDRRPMLSDLRESGSIEQDADLICMIYREEYYDKESTENRGHAEVIVAKQRNGPTGVAKMHWIPKYGSFANLAPASLQGPVLPPPRQMSPDQLPNFARRNRPPENKA